MSRVLVVAKAPVAGRVKTRLGADIGLDAAAEVAAAALLDTLHACAEAFPEGRRHLALAGDLAPAVRSAELREALAGWDVFAQEGDGFAERLVHAHTVVAGRGDGAVVQIGMDTPQVTPTLLLDAVEALGEPSAPDAHDGVLGPADDGGWWVLCLRDGRAAAPLATVPMSTPTTYDDTWRALEAAGLRLTTTAVLTDVDTVTEAEDVAALAPHGRFAEAWGRLRAT
ncbi:DUF2064 domain-containing protein [Nocardioides lijunqiniae]|uniref:DUF2064 domain-containing protein n=1 Tax=Nocardioides lijunqiniae TaxID=2760832 RepID=UPI00187866BD